MAHFAYKITVPADTAVSAPETLDMKLTYGIITHVQIVIPDGQKASTHLKLLHHEFQLYPLSRGYWYEGDGIQVEFDDLFPITTPPYALKAVAYNEDDTYEHALYVYINVRKPEELGYAAIPDFIQAKYKELIGATLEV